LFFKDDYNIRTYLLFSDFIAFTDIVDGEWTSIGFPPVRAVIDSYGLATNIARPAAAPQ
jgi:hypothetical protein